jgi:hypothetical protein
VAEEHILTQEDLLQKVKENPEDQVAEVVTHHQPHQELEVELPELQHLHHHKEILVVLVLLVRIGLVLGEEVLVEQDLQIQVDQLVDLEDQDLQVFMRMDHQIQ